MRDIKPGKNNKDNGKEFYGGKRSGDEEYELFESSEDIKKSQRKETVKKASGGATSKNTAEGVKSEFQPKPASKAWQSLENIKEEKKPDPPRSKEILAAGSKVGLSKIHGPDKSLDLKDEMEAFKKLIKSKKEDKSSGNLKTPKVKKNVRVGPGERMILLGVFGLVIVAGLIATVIFLPKTEIELMLRTSPLLVDEQVVVASNGGEAVPGEAFMENFELSGETPVTNMEIIGERATGTVQIVNATSQEQPMRERSRLVTADGQLFYMKKHAIVPPNSRVSVDVEADAAGEAGNIPAQRLDFAALDKSAQSVVYAEAVEQFSGGSGEEISVAGDSDFEGAKKAIIEQTKAEGEVVIRERLGEGYKLLEESWDTELKDFTTEAKAGDKIATIPWKAMVTTRVMGYQQDVLQEKLRARLESKLEDEYMLFPGAISYSVTVEEMDWEEGRAVLAARVTHTTIPQFSLDTLKDKLAGRGIDEARAYLEGLPGVRAVQIETWPFWVKSMPRIEGRINLDLQPERRP